MDKLQYLEQIRKAKERVKLKRFIRKNGINIGSDTETDILKQIASKIKEKEGNK